MCRGFRLRVNLRVSRCYSATLERIEIKESQMLPSTYVRARLQAVRWAQTIATGELETCESDHWIAKHGGS